MHTGIMGRGIGNGLYGLDTVNLRDFSQNSYGSVDDYPYGGGAGLVVACEPVFQAVEEAWRRCAVPERARVIYPTPQGRPFTQEAAHKLCAEDDLIFICGCYEGMDERIIEEVVTDQYSAGDYVLTSGELPALVMMNAIARLLPGVLHNEDSPKDESFGNGLLEYPQYTRPAEWHGREVPQVLLSGDHGKVDKWRARESHRRTKERRPELYRKYLENRGIF